MGPPPITIYLTTIASQPALRQRQEYLLRILQAKRIPFSSYDLASDEDAKRLWRRKAPLDKQQLPGILVGGSFVGTFQEFEEAVEYGELDQFLRRKEEWNEAIERPSLPVKPIGVPGANLPMEMTPERIRKQIIALQQPSPLKGKGTLKPINKEPEGSRIDVGDEVGDFGLQGVKVSEDELRDLVEQLGLGGDDAEDLIQGFSGNAEKKADTAVETPSKIEGKVKGEESAAITKTPEKINSSASNEVASEAGETKDSKVADPAADGSGEPKQGDVTKAAEQTSNESPKGSEPSKGKDVSEEEGKKVGA